MTLNQIASAIANNVGQALKEVGNFHYSIEQIEDEAILSYNSIILQNSGKLSFTPEQFAQSTGKLSLDLNVNPSGAYKSTNMKLMHTEIPKLSTTYGDKSVVYAGPADMSLNITKYFDNGYMSHTYSTVIKERPFVFIDMTINKNNKHDIYFYNIGGLRDVIIKAVFENAMVLYNSSPFAAETVEFPAPLSIQKMIIDKLSGEYIRNYKQLNTGYQPNTQTDQR